MITSIASAGNVEKTEIVLDREYKYINTYVYGAKQSCPIARHNHLHYILEQILVGFIVVPSCVYIREEFSDKPNKYCIYVYDLVYIVKAHRIKRIIGALYSICCTHRGKMIV